MQHRWRTLEVQIRVQCEPYVSVLTCAKVSKWILVRRGSKLQEIRILSPTGMLGSGFKIDSFKRGLAWEPTFIGCDSGTTDFGPYYLGTDELHFSRAAIKRDL